MRLTPRVAGFRSEYPAGFKLECMAGFVGTRTLGLFRRAEAPRAPAVDAFAAHIRVSFEKLRHLIARHEQAVIWRA
jgi:hypothetical protein